MVCNCTISPPEFDRSVNPIQTRIGIFYPTHYCQSPSPPGFKKLSTPLQLITDYLISKILWIHQGSLFWSKWIIMACILYSWNTKFKWEELIWQKMSIAKIIWTQLIQLSIEKSLKIEICNNGRWTNRL